MKKNEINVSELADSKRSKYFPMKIKDFTIEFCEKEIFYKEQNKIFKKVFPTGLGYIPSKIEGKELLPCYLEYRKIHSEKFLFKFKGKIIGWFQGEMDDFETFYMRNTGILPQFQKKGIYSAFLKTFEKYIFELGYARIASHHSPTNALILSLKIKAGYVIVGEETHERWGNLIKVVKFKSKKRYEYFFKKVN